jgi:hypothetical protein
MGFTAIILGEKVLQNVADPEDSWDGKVFQFVMHP